ncbi:acyltransferase family protein [Erwinia persicina]|uniref:acyltransferase family protein n=1 Tax=Erwinia persicina TaxID=55211 RepID=UPI0017813D95|nr:acyltransferase [Erwinia persicina]MBD8166112.1 acyltransferase [Erwinia persicina]
MHNKINSIHYLRGIAALLVVGFHARQFLNGMFGIKDLGNFLFLGGQAGVDLFFIISGFIIAYSTHDKNRSAPASFVLRRFFRIYPVFIISLLICYFVVNYVKPIEIASLLRSSLLIHTNYSLHGPFFGYNILYTAWTLTYELYFYLIFTISMSFNHKHRVLISSVLLLLPGVIIQKVYNGSISISGDTTLNNTSYPFLNFIASPMMVEFIYGMVLYKFIAKIKMPYFSGIFLFSCLSFTFICYFSKYRFGSGPANFGLWALVLMIGLMIYEQTNSIGENAILNTLGNISYSLYLTHVIVIYVMIYYPTYVPMYESTKGISRFAYIICASITASWLTHEYIEKPFITFGKQLIKLGNSTLPAQATRSDAR